MVGAWNKNQGGAKPRPEALSESDFLQSLQQTGGLVELVDQLIQLLGLGVAFDKDDTRGLDTRLNEIIKDMRADGTVREVLAKYMSNPDRYLEG